MSRSVRKGPAAEPGAVNQRAVDFREQLDAHTRTMVESFGMLLRAAKITNPPSTTREEFQVNVATASLSTAGEGLLRQIREVKLAVMLQDEAAMDREVDLALGKIAEERAELEKELEALSNELKAAYSKTTMDSEPEVAESGEKGQARTNHAGAGAMDVAEDIPAAIEPRSSEGLQVTR